MCEYTHYVTIDLVKYPYFESDSPAIHKDGIKHPDNKNLYLLDIGETKAQRKKLESEFEKFDQDPDFLVIPRERISTIGSRPSKGFKQNPDF